MLLEPHTIIQLELGCRIGGGKANTTRAVNSSIAQIEEHDMQASLVGSKKVGA